mmetsp:Transcript_19844/g.44043  ORF Transcript_19844/g.44043 Transcript_19844/m.44043 type:complete len:91 (+) Transcript_19844:265-537(+)|eukprot:CAMPEP_0204320000 /NCGR_PEP_ID=MMETSP0469-20131031/7416_1 /ASSEMBLY_ACC=CAM_ASM_000384 /TAXON_ID=2969 /ORGANISM="Oxyrrhis marina" /LENGTH=90 /DNA_ID=CAMNT_0051301243 /DNA_START=220 /DNA_END=492 /DNA_ORIENTATION=-
MTHRQRPARPGVESVLLNFPLGVPFWREVAGPDHALGAAADMGCRRPVARYPGNPAERSAMTREDFLRDHPKQGAARHLACAGYLAVVPS